MEPTLTTFLRGEAGFAYYAVTLIVPALSYVVYQVLYQLYLSPLAKFPGPNLAAVTRLYEVHYDLVLDGQHTFKIKELHRDYGPIIRTSPYELHIFDHTYIDTLYSLVASE